MSEITDTVSFCRRDLHLMSVHRRSKCDRVPCLRSQARFEPTYFDCEAKKLTPPHSIIIVNIVTIIITRYDRVRHVLYCQHHYCHHLRLCRHHHCNYQHQKRQQHHQHITVMVIIMYHHYHYYDRVFWPWDDFSLCDRSGDMLLAVNGHTLEGVSHTIAVSLLKGAKGTVTLRTVSWPGTLVWPSLDLENASSSVSDFSASYPERGGRLD